MQKRNEIIAIVDKAEYQKLMNYISHDRMHSSRYTRCQISAISRSGSNEECDTTVVKRRNIHGNLR